MLHNLVIIALTLAVLAVALVDGYSFVGIGDWGGAAIDAGYKKNVYDVADQMTTVAWDNMAQFVINTGDNFYWCGIQNTSDYQIQTDFVEPYKNMFNQTSWYSVLGNHEYGYNVQAQLDLAKELDQWIMDDRYYTRRQFIDEETDTYATFIFLDTSPCISGYRSESNGEWDPCGSEYPTCSLDSGTDDFEGTCMFHQNIISQSCTDQYNWLKTTLAAVPKDDWLIVVGHHPADEINVEPIPSLLQEHGFSIYMNGHTHTLAQYQVDNAGVYVTTGAGSMVNTTDQHHKITKAKLEGKDINTGSDNLPGENLGERIYSYKNVWNERVAGFTLHTFNTAFTELTTQYISFTGEVLHSIVSTKDGKITN